MGLLKKAQDMKNDLFARKPGVSEELRQYAYAQGLAPFYEQSNRGRYIVLRHTCYALPQAVAGLCDRTEA